MKIISKRKWLLMIIGIVIITVFIFNLLTFMIDPFFQYRVRDNEFLVNPTRCAPGLIKNYDYDTIIIGSSMIQNSDMDVFRTRLDCLPLNIAIGGMPDEDLVNYTLLANKVGKAKDYYLCIDIANFRNRQDSMTVDYLMKDDFLSHMQYAISYESVFRFMPMDFLFTVYSKTGHSLPKSYENRMKIDKMGYWGDRFTFGKDTVLNGLKTGTYSVSKVDTTDLYKKMVEGIDSFFLQLDLDNANYNFFFPPYSALFWSKAQDDGYFEVYLDAEKYFIKKADEYNATTFGFQDAELTTDLDNYKDTAHYSPAINDWMTECFARKDFIVTSENYSEYRERIVNNKNKLRSEYEYLHK